MTTPERKSLIIGAANAVLHQIHAGMIAVDRVNRVWDPDNVKYKHIRHLMDCIVTGKVPEKDALTYVQWTDALAHLQQSMRVPYDEWFEIFPWLDGVGRV